MGTERSLNAVSISAATGHDPEALRDLRNVIRLIQQDAKRTGLDRITEREINAKVKAAGKGMRA